MFKRSIWTTAMAFSLFLGVTVFAQEKVGKRLEDEAEQSSKAAKVLREIMGTPDKEMPEDLLARAECVAIFPSVIKAGFIVESLLDAQGESGEIARKRTINQTREDLCENCYLLRSSSRLSA
jgi:lipid-binding SYLF domain-containing protein